MEYNKWRFYYWVDSLLLDEPPMIVDFPGETRESAVETFLNFIESMYDEHTEITYTIDLFKVRILQEEPTENGEN